MEKEGGRMKKMLALGALLVFAAGSVCLAGGMEQPGTPGKGVAVEIPSEVVLSGCVSASFRDFENEDGVFDLDGVSVALTSEVGVDALLEAKIVADTDDVELLYGYLDYIWSDAVVLRAGNFLVPFGVYNEYLYSKCVAKLATAPRCVPTGWTESGIQLRGVIDTGLASDLNYAAYVANGGGQDGVDNNSDKTMGCRLGVSTDVGVTIGLSVVKDTYDVDGALESAAFGVDACYIYDTFELRGEYTSQSDDAVDADVTGYYVQGAYGFLDRYEVVARFDTTDVLGSDAVDRVTVGGNYAITDDLTFRLSYENCDDLTNGDGFIGMLALRF